MTKVESPRAQVFAFCKVCRCNPVKTERSGFPKVTRIARGSLSGGAGEKQGLPYLESMFDWPSRALTETILGLGQFCLVSFAVS